MTEFNAHVGSDGMLNLRLPAEFVDSEVKIRVSRASQTPVKRTADIEDPEERRRVWQEFVERTAGSIQDPTFERAAQD
jgi:hypothetical protein